MDTTNTIQSEKTNKRKNEEDINAGTAKKQKEKKYCDYCNKEYSNYGSLSTHYAKVHKGKINQCKDDPRIYVKRLERVEKNEHENDKTLQELVNWKKAETSLAEDRDLDRKKAHFLRVDGFAKNHFHNKNSTGDLKERINDEILNLLQNALKDSPQINFGIKKTKPYFKKNNVSVDIEFSNETNVGIIYHALSVYCQTISLSVSCLRSSGTEIRVAILNAIGNKACKGEKKFMVMFEDYKPRFIISKPHKEHEGEEVVFTQKYTHAVDKFKSIMEPNDFKDAAALCKKFGYKKEDCDQFLVQFP